MDNIDLENEKDMRKFLLKKYTREIIMAYNFFIILSLFVCGCKKSSSSLNNSSSGSNQWFFKCTVDSISTNVSGNGVNGIGGNGNINSFEGGDSYIAYASSKNPGIQIGINSECNTSASNPCLGFTASFEYLKVGSYKIVDSGLNSYGIELLTSSSNAYYGSFNIYDNIMAYNPTTSLTLNITYVGNVGENISGNFSGTVLKIGNPVNYINPQLINISGSFNVYREN
jgi:hypothetical protein